MISACAPSPQAIQTAVAGTQEAWPTQTPYPTYTLLPTYTEIPTATATDGPTPTDIPAPTTTPPSALVVGDYGTIAPGELETYAERHIGEIVKVILTITHFTPRTNNKEPQGDIAGKYANIIVDLANPSSGIYIGDTITIYGTINGNYSYVSTVGWNMTEPQIINAFYTKP